MPEFLREVTVCRANLEKFARSLTADEPAGRTAAIDRPIYPGSSRNVGEAADRVVAGLPEEDAAKFDAAIQVQVKAKCRAVVTVCVKLAEEATRFKVLLVDGAKAFLEPCLAGLGSAEAFFTHRDQPALVRAELVKAYEEALPPAGTGGVVSVVGAPDTMDGERFVNMVMAAQPGAKLATAKTADELVIVRAADVQPEALPQYAGAGRASFEHFLALEKLNCHNRYDIEWTE